MFKQNDTIMIGTAPWVIRYISSDSFILDSADKYHQESIVFSDGKAKKINRVIYDEIALTEKEMRMILEIVDYLDALDVFEALKDVDDNCK